MSEQGSKKGAAEAAPIAPFEPVGGGCAVLWDKVFHTDPAFTKDFTGKGGFQGTAISPAWLIMQATKAFGPMGIGWGVDLISESWIDGAPLGWDPNGNSWGREQVHRAFVKLWYNLKIDGEVKRGEVTQFGQTTYIGATQRGIFTDEEASKKSMTDGMSKCLSMLGFGADVHMNLFSDVKYLAGLHAMYGEANSDQQLTNVPPVGAGSVDSTRQGHQNNSQPQRAGEPLSKRYLQFKERLDDESQPLADVAVARQTVKQDKTMSEIEKALLLTHVRLKLPEQTEQSSDGVFL
ncbi:hypothetical protein [Ralstonia pseudosolanacearum]|uniref:hypothetical protein n=1 Tax=Ralstonia pseudosolanacearum TaxID=1310165 RepID=UPI003CF9EA45